ncbi:hypothetical protein QOZ80_6BG0502750 [Eleusine coracana subsp. coracana]|nr:hypothetical protein QOZ80_6BG0502750 [Eleusine coracana subsp. coracana]
MGRRGRWAEAKSQSPQAVGNPPRLPLLMVLPTAAPARIMGYVSVSPTCWMWDTTAAQLLHLLRLTLPSTSGPAFLRVFGDDVYRLPRFPDDALRGRFCGSFPGGWVALALEHYRGRCILNLHTGERIDLPDHVCTPSPPIDCITVIKYLTLSSSPTREGTFIVAAVTSGVANIAFWEPGAERWCPPTLAGLTDEQLQRWRRNLPRDPVDDILYFRGCLHEGFYVLNGDETLLVYVPEAGEGSNDKTPKVHVVSYLFQSGTSMTDPNSRVKARYLVETRGNLLMVRHLSSSDGSDQFEMFVLEGERHGS